MHIRPDTLALALAVAQSNRSRFKFFTYTAVLDNLNDGSKLASEGAAADQDEAANLDQLPGSERDIDIGHGEILQQSTISDCRFNQI